MCGIAGAIGVEEGSLVHAMVRALTHRGPDSSAVRRYGETHIGATRLAIVDPIAGAQPISNEDNSVHAVFNGEIYNHRQLRLELETKGHIFKTESDTEVLVHLYEEYGNDCVTHLRGMFAFAIVSRTALFLARDRLGIKPLFIAIAREGSLLLFASEIKALLACNEFKAKINQRAFADFLTLGHPCGADTFFRNIEALPPGHFVCIARHSARKTVLYQRFFDFTTDRSSQTPFLEAKAGLDNVIKQAVSDHLSADTEVALTLSGGLDSTLLALYARDISSHPLRTFSVADDGSHPDVVQAARVAHLLGTRHHTSIITFDRYLAAIPSYIAAEEQPAGLYGLPFYLLCGEIRQHVKCCAHGEGSDELFGGYREYVSRSAFLLRLRRRLRTLRRTGLSPSTAAHSLIERVAAASSFEAYLEEMLRHNLTDPLVRHHLDPVDRCSMAFGLEIRVPYLADEVVELATKLPSRFLVDADLGIRKYILRHLCVSRFGLDFLDTILREKLGVPASGVHLLERFDELCDALVDPTYFYAHPLNGCFGRHRELLLFEFFLHLFFECQGATASAGSMTEFLRSRDPSNVQTSWERYL